MNLSAYEIVPTKMQIKTWIDKKNKRICSREIPFYNYFYIAKRYNPFYDVYSYYLIVTNERLDDPVPRCAARNGTSVVRFNVRDIWIDAGFNKRKEINLNVKLVDKQEDCLVYVLDI